jgi:hypothetical protein
MSCVAHTDEDILTYTVSDEAIEAAAGGWGTTPMCTSVAVPCPTSEFPCLTSTVSDEEMEAAAGIESQNSTVIGSGIAGVPCCPGLAEEYKSGG